MALAWSCTVAEAKARCTIEEFRQWLTYYSIEPFGEFRHDVRCAIIACAIAQAGGMTKATLQDFMPEKFIGHNSQEKPKQTIAEMAVIFSNYAKMHNAFMKRSRAKQGTKPSATASAT